MTDIIVIQTSKTINILSIMPEKCPSVPPRQTVINWCSLSLAFSKEVLITGGRNHVLKYISKAGRACGFGIKNNIFSVSIQKN